MAPARGEEAAVGMAPTRVPILVQMHSTGATLVGNDEALLCRNKSYHLIFCSCRLAPLVVKSMFLYPNPIHALPFLNCTFCLFFCMFILVNREDAPKFRCHSRAAPHFRFNLFLSLFTLTGSTNFQADQTLHCSLWSGSR